MKILLVHLPVILPPERAPRGPFINIMPVGLVALADRLERAGHEVEIVHAGVEQRLDPGFDLETAILADSPDLVGFSLHWHHQIGPVGDAVEALHAARPELPIVLGGMTASAFASEILERWPGVDFVVRGEAERPIEWLAGVLAGHGGTLDEVANLVRRAGDRVVTSTPVYLADRADLDDLDFSRLDLVRHHRDYNAQFARDDRGWSHRPIFYLCTGRGCTLDCIFCSGGRSGQRLLAGRRAVTFRSVDRVADEIERVCGQGVRTVCAAFDPPPRSEPYHRDLFAAIRGKDLPLSMVFECYRPPSDDFLEEFARTFDPQGSRIFFSPTVGDDRLRARLLGAPYTNEQLEQALATCRRLEIKTTLYFAILPQETRRQLDRSLGWQDRLMRDFASRIVHAPIEMEPAAPWSRSPVAHGMSRVRKGLTAYERRHRQAPSVGVCYADEVGYQFAEADARAVRAASALLDERAIVARALATCGKGRPRLQVLVGPGRLDDALGLLAGFRGVPMDLYLADDRLRERPWDLADRVAAELGPAVRLIPLDERQVRHALWTPGEPVAVRDERDLYVLHLRDDLAARALANDPAAAGRLAATAVVAEECRWTPGRCPALVPGTIALGADGALRCCPSSPDLGLLTPARLRDVLAERARQVAAERGCATCPVASHCSQCLFTGRISPAAFCEARRRMGPQCLIVRSWRSLGTGRPEGIAIGWD